MTDFNPMKLIQDAIAAGFDPGTVSDIDERQLPWAKNIVEWVMGTEFLNTKTIFPIQLQVLLKLFGDVCYYCSDADYYTEEDWEVNEEIGNILDRIQLLHHGKCPKCHKTRLDHFHDKLWGFPNELDVCWGMRSGKSAIAAGLGGSYVLHRYLRLPDPAAHFGQLKGQELFMRFVALTQKQAKDANWMQFKRAINTSDWFAQYHDFLDYHGRKKGVELYKWIAENFAYFNKGIGGYVVGAADDTSRGRTSIFVSIDEIAFFSDDEKAKKANPEETYTAYEASCETIRNVAIQLFKKGDYNIPNCYMMVHSSTKSKDDYIIRLIKAGRTDPFKVVSHKASWEINAQLDKDFLEEKKKKNLKLFMRDFGSEPPFAKDPFIEDRDAVLKTATIHRPAWTVKTDKSFIGPFLDANLLEKNRTIPFCLAIDMGKVDCGWAAVLLRLKEEDFSVAQVAGAFAVYPYKGSVIDLDGMYKNFILPLCERLFIRLVVFDQWQSATQIDGLKKFGVNAMQFSLQYKHFLNFRTNLFQGKLETVEPEMPFSKVENSNQQIEEILFQYPYLHMLWQTLSVSEIGNKITKGDGHDDLFRALVLGSTFMWDDDYRRDFEYKNGVLGRHAKGGLAISGGSKGGGMYSPQPSVNTHVRSVNGRALGTFVPKTKRW